jgi:hypothetical protein
MRAEPKRENIFHRVMIAPLLRLMDWASGRKLPAKRAARGRN